jgi:hypothetical protein
MQMNRIRLVLAVGAGTVAISLTPLTALAATPYHDTVRGIELSATSTEGRFAGQAGGDLPGYWYADVIHTPLNGSAAISGGTFVLATNVKNQATLVTGQFTGGSVVQTGGISGCTNQTYAVNGALSNGGSFVATLTHYRVSIYGHCLIYAASIAGLVTLNL